MVIDKFGRSSSKVHHQRLFQSKLENIRFPRTSAGDLDVENHRICNLSDPIDSLDAVTKKYVDQRTYDLILILRATKLPGKDMFYFRPRRIIFPITFTGVIEDVDMYPTMAEMHHNGKHLTKDKLIGYKLKKGDEVFFKTDDHSNTDDLYCIMTVKCTTA